MKHGVTSASALRRFEYESQLLARLSHPGIAQIHEAGTHEGVPFFASAAAIKDGRVVFQGSLGLVSKEFLRNLTD